MRIFNRTTLFVPPLVFSSLLAAQDETNRETSAESPRLPYEVIVTPNVTRADLRQLIIQVEEDFFAKFNELNIDEDYDVTCYKYTPTMSHITKRVCEPWFMIRARGLNASEVTFGLASGSGSTGSGFNSAQRATFAMPPETMRREMSDDYEVLQEKMEAFTKSNIEFRSIAEALLELKAQLENFGED